MDRREFLAASAALTLVPTLSVAGQKKGKPFRFGFVTDTHLGTPESLRWTETALRTLRKRYPDVRLLIHGGDLLDQADALPSAESASLVTQWREIVARHSFDARHVIGNHDLAALKTPEDPGHGKTFFTREIGALNSHLMIGPIDFLFLDSIGLEGGAWEGRVEPLVLKWLAERLAAIPTENPIVIVSHIPLLTIMPQYDKGTPALVSKFVQVQNAKDVYELLRGHRVVAMLQGHTHVQEICDDRWTQWTTGGAICGDWWKGPRFGRYEPNFGVCNWDGERLTTTFETYGWKPG